MFAHRIPRRLVTLFVSLIACTTPAAAVSPPNAQRPAASDTVQQAAAHADAAVVLRVSDGKVLAARNPAVLTRRLAAPGSAIKPFVLQLMLESGAIRPGDRIVCRRPLTIGGHNLNCSHPPEVPSFVAEDALAFSCNSYFATAATHLQPGALERRFEQLGFTRATGLMSGEAEGRVLRATTVEARQLLALGISGVEVTPLELASAYVKLAREATQAPDGATQVVLAGLRGAVTYGLAQNARAPGLSVAGKTGTAGDPTNPATHAWFAGFAPAEKPEIVVVVFVERGHGSVEAAEAARRIFEAYAEQRR